MKKQYIAPEAIEFNVQNAELLAGSTGGDPTTSRSKDAFGTTDFNFEDETEDPMNTDVNSLTDDPLKSITNM